LFGWNSGETPWDLFVWLRLFQTAKTPWDSDGEIGFWMFLVKLCLMFLSCLELSDLFFAVDGTRLHQASHIFPANHHAHQILPVVFSQFEVISRFHPPNIEHHHMGIS